MNGEKIVKTLGAMLLVAVLASAALANQIAGVLVTGTVTSVQGGGYIGVDGHTYHIKTGSLAAAAIQSVVKGQQVDVRLSGPANSSASEVINIAPHQGQ
jgi:hypothetical protein